VIVKKQKRVRAGLDYSEQRVRARERESERERRTHERARQNLVMRHRQPCLALLIWASDPMRGGGTEAPQAFRRGEHMDRVGGDPAVFFPVTESHPLSHPTCDVPFPPKRTGEYRKGMISSPSRPALWARRQSRHKSIPPWIGLALTGRHGKARETPRKITKRCVLICYNKDATFRKRRAPAACRREAAAQRVGDC